ncbi:MAG TPA: hypothetical protein DCY56_04530 [Candidatus Omnitrophica bacterium]|nr:hypothetical protein [Candidatus Omnitrophota bacterium]
MNTLKYSEILKVNREMGRNLSDKRYEIVVLSNIITHMLNDILEYYVKMENINAHVKSGDYDNIVQESEKFRNSNLVIIFWEIANIIDGMQYKANIMNNDEIEAALSKIKAEIDFTLTNLKDASLVLFNRFSSLIFNYKTLNVNNLDKICENLNRYLEQKKSSNIILIDTDRVIAKGGIEKSLDFRYYYSSRALYTIEFYKNYAEYIKPIILSANGKAKKAIIFDCDNTLWKGVLGEDELGSIEMSSRTRDGAIFEEVQHLALELNKKGILIGLCSKNNPQDVDEVIAHHADMKIKDEHIAIKKVNWGDKISNLKAIASELNIGLDSLVFVEDSDFEANCVREFLHQVTVLKVPKELSEYPNMLRGYLGLFYNISESKEDMVKAKMYNQQSKREQEKTKFSNLDDYLKSLDLKLTIHIDNQTIISRISQLTQKTNQFNLTTKRYTEFDIKKFMEDKKYKIFDFNVKDKFGDYGITGLCIVLVDYSNRRAEIDTFLMSCRVIGRKIDFSFSDYIIEHLKELDVELLEAKYIKSLKNEQVFNFYERIGFELINGNESEKSYRLKLSNYRPKCLEYIKVEDGRKN